MSRKPAARKQDDPARVALIGLGVMIGLLLFTLGVVALGLAGFSRLSPPQVAATPRPPPPGPRLEADPAVDLAAVRRQGEARLETYGWTDQAHGVARIPIERAMQMQATRGWADPEPPAYGRVGP